MAERSPGTQPVSQSPLSHHLFAGAIGIFLALALLKWGTPVVLDYKVSQPVGLVEVFYNIWPVNLGYFALALVFVGSLFVARWEVTQPKWPLVALGVWLGWQFVAGMDTVDSTLTAATLKHFTAAAVCFAIGYFALARVTDLRLLQVFLLLGFFLILRVGLDQHFGGLEETRKYFYAYILPRLQERPEDYIQKISTNRIFSTLFYPNSFAGAILLFLPMSAFSGWVITKRFGRLPQIAMVSIVILASLACLYWSGSKSGWLIMLVLALVCLWQTSFSRQLKIGILAAVLIAGGAGFAWKYSGFFQKGATSVAARFDYWEAALDIFKRNPILGTGPGTFSKEYAAIKRPESEMARLAHNDYIEQACDSGIIGFLAFALFILGSLAVLGRTVSGLNWRFVVWLGTLGVSLQAFSEFNFYIPALAWPVFLFLGWLWATKGENEIGKAA